MEKATADIRDEIHEIQKAKLDGDSNNTVKQFRNIQAVFKKPAEQRTAYEEQLAQLVQRQVDNKWQKINWEKELAKKDETLPTTKRSRRGWPSSITSSRTNSPRFHLDWWVLKPLPRS